MAYRELGMWEVLDVLRRVHRGEAKASIERVTGRTRKTIRRYLKAAAKAGWEPGSREPDEALAATGGNVARAARRLGLARSTLRHRIARHGLGHLIPQD